MAGGEQQWPAETSSPCPIRVLQSDAQESGATPTPFPKSHPRSDKIKQESSFALLYFQDITGDIRILPIKEKK